jgi:hypothetical protein
MKKNPLIGVDPWDGRISAYPTLSIKIPLQRVSFRASIIQQAQQESEFIQVSISQLQFRRAQGHP